MALPRVIIDVGFSSPTVTGADLHLGDPARGLLGTGTIGSDDIWIDITQWVRSWSIRRGATRVDGPTLRYEPGTATIELNDPDRRFDPENLAGPYVAAGQSQVEPMRRVRIRAVWDDITYPLYYGYSDAWSPSYQANTWTYVTLTATDAEKVLASYDRQEGAAVGAGEDSGARIHRILDAAGWPEEDRLIAVGDSTMQATTMAGNTMTELLLVQDSEQGDLYLSADGKVVFRNRQAIFQEERSTTAQAVFGDAGLDAGELPYADVQLLTDDAGLANLITASRAGGTAQQVEDAGSRARYLTRTHQRTDLLLETDEEVLLWASALLHQSAQPERRFSELRFLTPRPQVAADVWPALLGREFGDRITIRRRPPGGGDPIEKDAFVRGVQHTSDGESWTSALVLQSASRYSFFVVGDPVLGVLGENALAY